MKGKCGALVLAILFGSSLALCAQTAKSSPAPASKGGEWGLLFDAKNLLALDGFEDGYQAGAGIMYWPAPKIAARALIGIDHNDPEGDVAPTRTVFGLSLAGQWHPSKGKSVASPYVGATAGFRSLAITGLDTAIDIYFGAIGGVECKLFGPVSFFGEYQLLAVLDAQGFTLSLGTEGSDGSRALLGFIFYF